MNSYCSLILPFGFVVSTFKRGNETFEETTVQNEISINVYQLEVLGMKESDHVT